MCVSVMCVCVCCLAWLGAAAQVSHHRLQLSPAVLIDLIMHMCTCQCACIDVLLWLANYSLC